MNTNQYPKDDDQFEEVKIFTVEKYEDGSHSITRADGFSFYVPADSSVAPVAGMAARFYGKGIGFVVRGLFLDGVKVFYRTEEEEKERDEIERYGADAADWLKRWDEGKTVWSIEMGGLGPSYEQCIHITCAEMLRHMLKKSYNAEAWGNEGAWKHVREEIDAAISDNETVSKLGLSGGQYSGALNLACMLYRRGPRFVMNDERVKDRHIMISRNFPQG